MDLSKTIEPKSDQLNADDLIAGPRTITITEVRGKNDPAQPIAVHFDGDNGKPWKPCKSMRRVMVKIWGKDGLQYVGRSLTLFCDPRVKFGGIEVGGIRVSHMSHIEGTQEMALTVSKAKRAPYKVLPLEAAQAPTQEAKPPLDIEAAMKALDAARNAALGGSASFTAWWQGEGRDLRALVRADLAELQKIAEEADAVVQDDPFGLPPADQVDE